MKKNYKKIATKNAVFNTSTKIISKIGSLIFTIIIARTLLPELFGIYSIILSIALNAITFTDLGIDATIVRYFSEAMGQNKIEKARSYFRYLAKIKIKITFIIITLILLFSKIIANQIFNKPALFYPIIFSTLYILTNSIYGIFLGILYATNDLKKIPIIEMLNQTLKIIFSIIIITILSTNLKVSGIFLAYALSLFGAGILVLKTIIKKNKKLIIGKISKIEKLRIKKYLSYMSIASISLIFFGAIDTIMLGLFVSAKFIGLYKAALSLVLAIAVFPAISSSLLPIFTQIDNRKLERGFKKISKYLFILAIPITTGLIILGKDILLAIYGIKFIEATKTLIVLSPLIITFALTELYSGILQAKEQSKILAKQTIIALIINIILNYVAIINLIKINQEMAIIGVGISTVISRIIYLNLIRKKTNKIAKLKIYKSPIMKSLFATMIMATFLITFNKLILINIWIGTIEIILASGIYFGIMLLIKGIKKEDIYLFKSLKNTQ